MNSRRLKAAGIYGKRQDEIRRALRQHTSASLRRAVDALFMTYLDMRRGGGGGDPRMLMERMVFRVMGRG